MHKDFIAGSLTDASIEEMLSADKPNQRETLKIPTERLQGKIPKNFTKAQVEDYVVKAVEYYHRYLQRQRENSR